MKTPDRPTTAKDASAPRDVGLTRIDRLMICGMLSGSRDKLVPLTPETEIGGKTLREILEFADCDLYLALDPRTPSQKMFASLLVRAHRAATECFNDAWKYQLNPTAFEPYMKYALKATETFVALYDRYEKYRTERSKQLLRNLSIDFDDALNAESRSEHEVPISNGPHANKKRNGSRSRKAGHTNGRHP